MRRLTTAMLTLFLASCSDKASDVTTPPPPPPPPPAPPGLLISGADMSGGPQNIYITRNNVAVTGATVTVNGIAMTDLGFGTYQGSVTPFVNPGGTMTLVVTSAGQTLTAIGTVPSAPVIGEPPVVTRGNPIPVSWTANSSPDTFFVGLNYTVGQISYNAFVRVAGAQRTANIPTADIPFGATGQSLVVFGYNIGTFTGDFAVGSNMRVRTLGTDRPFTFGP